MTFMSIRTEIKKGDYVRALKPDLEVPWYEGTVGNNLQAKEINDYLTLDLDIVGDISITRNFDVTATKLKEHGENQAPYVFNDNGRGGYSFTVTVAIVDEKMAKKLDYIYVNRCTVNLSCESPLIPSVMYRITNLTKRTASSRYYSEWELECTEELPASRKTNINPPIKDYLTLQLMRYSYKDWISKKKMNVKWHTKKKGKTKTVKRKVDYNQVNSIMTQIFIKLGLYTAKIKGQKKVEPFQMFDEWRWEKKKVKVGTKKFGDKKLDIIEKKDRLVYPKQDALLKFKKRWNKKGLKPKLTENRKKDKKTFEALKRWTEVK